MPTDGKQEKALSSSTNTQEQSESAKISTCSLVILNDQGGAVMEVMKDDIAPCLRSQTHAHEPVVCYCIDMGGGKSAVDILKDKSPTLTTTHYGTPVACIGFDVYNNDATGNVAMSITGAASDSHHIPVVCYFYDHHPQDSRVTYEKDTANSITSRYGTGGGNTPIVVEVHDG